MKILQVVHKAQRRGAEIFAWQLSERFKRLGHSVHTVYLYPYTGSSPLSILVGCEILNGNEESVLETSLGFHPSLLHKLDRAITAFGPDIVQLNGGRTVKYGALLRAFNRNSDYALIYRNIGDPAAWLRGRLRRLYYRRYLISKVDGIIAVSAKSREFFRSSYSEKIPIEMIPTGLETE